jgi:hypothetical protein
MFFTIMFVMTSIVTEVSLQGRPKGVEVRLFNVLSFRWLNADLLSDDAQKCVHDHGDV